MKTCHIFISGFVQGVGFRRFVKKNCIKLGLTGWVMNIPTGQVEAIIQGKTEDIEKEIRIMKKGPFISEVKNLEIFWEKNSENYSGFEIIK